MGGTTEQLFPCHVREDELSGANLSRLIDYAAKLWIVSRPSVTLQTPDYIFLSHPSPSLELRQDAQVTHNLWIDP